MDARQAAELIAKELDMKFSIESTVAEAIAIELAPLLAAKDQQIDQLRSMIQTGLADRDRLAAEVKEWTKSTIDGIRDYQKLLQEHSRWLGAIQRTDDLEQQVAELRRDAERYLALLDQCESVFRTQFIDLGDCEAFKAAEQIRAVLDAALAAQKT